jgi:hypothetical protein
MADNELLHDNHCAGTLCDMLCHRMSDDLVRGQFQAVLSARDQLIALG